MSRYFIEVAYKGTRYSGFQIQENAVTIQSVLESALRTFYKEDLTLTGSSRTDAGVHALQNFFHFDTDVSISDDHIYNINSILPNDVTVNSIKRVADDAHCRFHADSRVYRYYIYTRKNPFLTETAWYYPYKLDILLLTSIADNLIGEHDFTSFAKRNSQVHTHICTVKQANWTTEGNKIVFTIEANRFLRGMVRALVATQLKVGRQTISVQDFMDILNSRNCTMADFSAPGHGLFLTQVKYPSPVLS